MIAWGPGPTAGKARLYYMAMTSSGGRCCFFAISHSDNEGATWSSPFVSTGTRPWFGGYPDLAVDIRSWKPQLRGRLRRLQLASGLDDRHGHARPCVVHLRADLARHRGPTRRGARRLPGRLADRLPRPARPGRVHLCLRLPAQHAPLERQQPVQLGRFGQCRPGGVLGDTAHLPAEHRVVLSWRDDPRREALRVGMEHRVQPHRAAVGQRAGDRPGQRSRVPRPRRKRGGRRLPEPEPGPHLGPRRDPGRQGQGREAAAVPRGPCRGSWVPDGHDADPRRNPADHGQRDVGLDERGRELDGAGPDQQHALELVPRERVLPGRWPPLSRRPAGRRSPGVLGLRRRAAAVHDRVRGVARRAERHADPDPDARTDTDPDARTDPDAGARQRRPRRRPTADLPA